MFRAAVASGSPLGVQVKALLDSGALVPDEITDQVVSSRLREPDATAGWLLDGYPRTLAQVAALDSCLAEYDKQLNCVLVIEVPTEELIHRLLLRGEREGRSDDNAETIARRLDVYRDQTEPVIAQYASRGIVARVDGTGTVAETAARITAALDPVAGVTSRGCDC
jgi:adenylate kinase